MRSVRRVLVLLCTPFLSLAQNDPRIPAEVRYKSGYVNPAPKPPDFTSAVLWGIAIADTRVPGYEHAQVEIARTQLSCRVDGKDVILNDDHTRSAEASTHVIPGSAPTFTILFRSPTQETAPP